MLRGVTTRVTRPVWRSFTQRYLANAATHVRAGGHALVWKRGPASPIAWMLVPCDADGDVPELSFWSILALEKNTYELVRGGCAKGLAILRIPRAYEQAVEEWCERDSIWPGTTRDVAFDCLECGSCCRDNHVKLYDEDFTRWTDAGRDDLAGRAYLRTVKGRVMLRLRKDPQKSCVHLADDNKCNIYALRPFNCSSFPVGSEPCLESRRDEMNRVDGAPILPREMGFYPRRV